MQIHKKEEFGRRKQQLAQYAKAISHPARIAILRKLAQDGKCICGELVAALPLSQSTVSQHLKELKNAGLIRGTFKGAKSIYSLNQHTIEMFRDEFKRLMNNLREK
jgi:ArsR family transcriptional regulator, arsenate/arsenite/antimonite-responsive transcriptional repressor